MNRVPEILQRLENAAACRTAVDLPSAERAAEALGLPVRVSAGGWRMRVDTAADMALAWAKANKWAQGAPVLVQAWTEGPVYRVPGFKVRRAFHVAEILSELWLGGLHPVPMTYAAPCGLDGRAYAAALETAHAAGAELPSGGYYAEVELVRCEGRFVVTGLHGDARPEARIAMLLRLAQGIDLEAAARRAAICEVPDLSPSRDMAGAVSWITPHSGVVAEIGGLEAARSIPWVREVVVKAKLGETLRHIVDLPSREQAGWVLAVAPTRAEALQSAAAACGTVQVVTRRTLD